MSTLTMAQRRTDFEAMLKRANRIQRAGRFHRPASPEPPVLILAGITEDIAALSRDWVECAHRTLTGAALTQMGVRAKMQSLIVAAHCLQALNECESAPDRHDLLDWITARAKFWFEESEEEWLDMGVAPCDRVQSLIGALGRVAVFWPAAPCVINQLGEDEGTHVQFDTLVRLTFEAVCAALAAERGLWQEEES